MFNVFNPPVLSSVISFVGSILANQTSVVVTHNLGRLAKVNGIYGTDAVNPASDFIVTTEGVNSFVVAWKSGISQISDSPFQGTYV